jgi:tetratricopeptide (TPR) repeat protein
MVSAAEELARAKAYHGAGQLSEALQLYQRIVQADAAHAEAHYLLGAACHGLGRASEAIASLARAVRLRPDYADAHNYLGAVLTEQGALDEALASFQRALLLRPGSSEISKNVQIVLAAKDNSLGNALAAEGKASEAAFCYRRALERQPDLAEAHYNLGALLEKQGALEEAVTSYRRAIELKPDFAEAHYNLGGLREKQGSLAEAVACYRRAVELKPGFAEAHNNLALVLRAQNQLDDAAACFRRALELKPDFAEAHNNLALVLTEQNQFDLAAACCRRALELKPDFAQAHNNLGLVLHEQNRLEEAAACYRRALELKPDFAQAHNNLGLVLRDQNQLEEAAACFRRALELKPDFAQAHKNLALVLQEQNLLEEATACYRRALALKPDFAEAHYNQGLTWLLMGRFAEGWSGYEWRWKRKGNEERILAEPRWTGSPLAGRTILLHSEQGLGDTLQFIRYAELVKRQGGTVLIEVHPALASLLARCPGVDRVIAGGEPLPKFDVHLPLLSLPRVFGTSLETVPAKVPYLLPDAASLEKWKRELGAETGFKIGIAWQGNPAHRADRFRSIPLARFAGLARMRGVHLYSLQMGAGREQLSALAGPLPITDLGDRLGDFDHTAAIVRNLDLVITCDSAPAHLAGALGVPVWVALAFAPDWRWMLDRGDSPWYPTMRLFRQNAPGDWEGVFERIQGALASLV